MFFGISVHLNEDKKSTETRNFAFWLSFTIHQKIITEKKSFHVKLAITFFALLLLSRCSSQNTDNQLPGNINNIETAVSHEASPFPVYMTFSEFEHHLRRQSDTTYIVNFWATWCKPCVAELPYFERLIPAVKERPVQVLLVSMDFPKQIKTKLIPFVKQRGLEKSVVALADMDYNEWIDKVSTQWDGAIPFTLIYNKTKQQIKLGELSNYEELEGLLHFVMDK